MTVKRRAYGPTVRAVREALGLPSAEVAARAGISQGYLTNIEKGRRRPEADNTAALAAALGVDVEILTGQKPVIGGIRTALGIDREVFARDVGVTPAHLDRIELGIDTPAPRTLALIATRLGVDPDVVTHRLAETA